MRIEPCRVAGAYVVEVDPVEDVRGSFARTFCRAEFERAGLDPCIDQCSMSWNRRAGTLRGMHYQAAPHEEAKLVRVTRGSVFDVVLDLRPGSETYLRWHGVELTYANRRALYIPKGCAHGFQTLADDTEVFYQISVPFVAAAARGVRWDDAAFGIGWPQASERILSDRDRHYPDYSL